MIKELIELNSKYGVIEYTWNLVQENNGVNEYCVTLFINGAEVDTDYVMGNNLVPVHNLAHELYQEYKETTQP